MQYLNWVLTLNCGLILTFLNLVLIFVAEFFIGVEDVEPDLRSGVAVTLLGAEREVPTEYSTSRM